MSLLFPFRELDKLHPSDVAVAEVKALVGAGEMTKEAFREIVCASGASTIDGNAWSTQKLNESLQRLTRKRLIQGDGQMHPDWRDMLALEVARRPYGRARIAALRAAAPKSWIERNHYKQWKDPEWYDDAALSRSVRLMALANEGAELEPSHRRSFVIRRPTSIFWTVSAQVCVTASGPRTSNACSNMATSTLALGK
jgi:hypothetical protein